MRFALAIIAAFANAAGPWLCCCAMTAMIVEPRAAAGEPHAPIESVENCTHCCEEYAKPTDTGKPHQKKPCPCQERLELISAVAPAATETSFVTDAIAADFHHPIGFVEILPTPKLAAAFGGGSPFLTAETRQRVHHVMHC